LLLNFIVKFVSNVRIERGIREKEIFFIFDFMKFGDSIQILKLSLHTNILIFFEILRLTSRILRNILDITKKIVV